MATTTILEVFKGDHVVFDIQFVKPNKDNPNVLEPYSLDPAPTNITINMPGTSADVTFMLSPLDGITITDGPNGKIQITITETKSAELKKGDRQTFYAIIEDAAGLDTTVKFRSSLSVDARDFRS